MFFNKKKIVETAHVNVSFATVIENTFYRQENLLIGTTVCLASGRAGGQLFQYL